MLARFTFHYKKKTGTETEISSQRRGAAKAKSSGKPSSHKDRVRGAESAMSASETADPSSCGSGVRGEGRNKSSGNDPSSHKWSERGREEQVLCQRPLQSWKWSERGREEQVLCQRPLQSWKWSERGREGTSPLPTTPPVMEVE